jgi:hypothetical protein
VLEALSEGYGVLPHIPQVVEDLLANFFGHYGRETVPFNRSLEVSREFVPEGWFMEVLANECTCLPLVKAEFDLV